MSNETKPRARDQNGKGSDRKMNEKSMKATGTYTLKEGSLDRIVSPVTLIFPDRSKKTYRDGRALAAAEFDRSYRIKSIAAVDDEIGIILTEEEEG